MRQVPPPTAHALDRARPQIDGLTGIRALAAAWVVLEHFNRPLFTLFPGAQAFDNFIYAGFLGVEVFFVLSGFIIAYTYAERFERFSWTMYRNFMLLRFARIYPVHLVTLTAVLGLVIAAAVIGIGLNSDDVFTLGNFVANLFLLQNVQPFSAVNGPAWSISTEFAAYAAFPLVALGLARIKSSRVGFITAAILLFAGTTLMMTMAFEAGLTQADYSMKWARIATEFTAGAALYGAWRHLGDLRVGRHWNWIALVTALATIGIIFSVEDASPFALASVPLIALFVLSCAGATGWLAWFLSSRTMVWGGKVSYSVYMTHYLLMMILAKLLPWDAFADSPLLVRLGLMGACYTAVILIGAFCYYAVEEPARLGIRRGTATRQKEPAAASGP